MRRAIYPGSFDPVTNGHVDVITRAARLFDELIVAVAHNPRKICVFTPPERVGMIEIAVRGLDNVRAVHFDGLLVDLATRERASTLVRGLRAVSDFEFEFQMALMNRKLRPEIETIFLAPGEEFTYLSSGLVKEIAMLGGDIGGFVPPTVREALEARLSSLGR